MKRSKFVQLSLAAAVSVSITGCSPDEQTVTASKKFTFQTVKECTEAKIPVDVCSDAYMNAMAEHRRVAPAYATKADCEADFIEGYCEIDSKGEYLPRLGGFELTAAGTFTQSQVAQAQASAGASGSSGGSSGGGNDLLTGLLIGNLLSNNGGHYYSEPVYRHRDDRGSYSNSTLGRRIESGTTFDKAVTPSRQPYVSTGYSPPAKKIDVQAAVSRGGFGSSSAAKSGWGGSSHSSGG